VTTTSSLWRIRGSLHLTRWVLYAVAAAGTLALLGFIGLRLLSAALLAVLYLLLAPVAVLAPAFGEGGRAAFRQWAARLLGALVTKLVYSVLLGVVLLMLRILLSLDALGWWTQWLLIAAFWWVAYLHRHQLLGHLFGEQSRRGSSGLPRAAGRGLMRFARVPAHAAASAAGTVLDRMRELPSPPGHDGGPWPDREPHGGRDPRQDVPRTEPDPHRSKHAGAGEPTASVDPAVARRALDDQLQRLLDAEHAEAAATMSGADEAGDGASGDDERRRVRLHEAITSARRDRDARRLASLQLRLAGVDAGIQERQAAIRDARMTLSGSAEDAAAAAAPRTGDPAPAASARERRARDLDQQALLPRASQAGRRREPGGRDYLSLTALAGVGRAEYRRMASADRRRVRIEIDRELERRREWSAAASQVDAGEVRTDPPASPPADLGPAAVTPSERSARERQFTREQFEELLG
jgi:hypothetical protein